MLLNLASRKSESGEYVVCRMASFIRLRRKGGSDLYNTLFSGHVCVSLWRWATWQTKIRKIVLIFFGRVTGDLFQNLVGSPVLPPKEVF